MFLRTSVFNPIKPLPLALMMLASGLDGMAKCGAVDYSWGADALASSHDYLVTMMLYTLYVCSAIAGIMVIVSSLQIYIKMNTGEEGVVRDILMCVLACLFLIGAAVVFPAFFGYRI